MKHVRIPAELNGRRRESFNRVCVFVVTANACANEKYDLLIGVNGKRLVQRC